jgi:hypothetical protein
MDGMEIASDMTPGQENLFDFIDAVLAGANAPYAANTPAAFGMALRFTGKGSRVRKRGCSECNVGAHVYPGIPPRS